jgi:histone-lysine N-methyltransferase SETD1
MDNFSQGEIVCEYVGEIISHKVADQREKNYEKRGIGDCYMFKLDEDRVIDATVKGNYGRFINHSCEANCIAKVELL